MVDLLSKTLEVKTIVRYSSSELPLSFKRVFVGDLAELALDYFF